MAKYPRYMDDIPFFDNDLEQPFYKKPLDYAGKQYGLCVLFFGKINQSVQPTITKYFRGLPVLENKGNIKHQMSVEEFQKYSIGYDSMAINANDTFAFAFETDRIQTLDGVTQFDLDKVGVNPFTGLPPLKIRSRGLSQHEKEYRDLCEIRDTVLSERKTTYKIAGVTYSLGHLSEQRLTALKIAVSILCELTEAWLQRRDQIREFNKKGSIDILSEYLPERQIEMLTQSRRIFADCIEKMYEYCYAIYYRGSEIDLAYGRALSALQTERYHALSDAREREGRGAQTEMDFPATDPRRDPRRDPRNWRGAYGEEVYEPEFGGSDEYDPHRDENPPRQRHPSFLRRCVVDVAPRVGLGRAFGICTATMKKAGYYDEDGNLTEKGRKRQRHFSAQKDMREYDAKYERLLAAARKK